METKCSSETLASPTTPHDLTTQNTKVNIFTAVKTSNFKTLINVLPNPCHLYLEFIARTRTNNLRQVSLVGDHLLLLDFGFYEAIFMMLVLL
jgi:hypothetical protein